MTQAFEISLSGMDVEWRRMEIIAQNLANAGTTRTANGEPYQPVTLVSGPRMASFAASLNAQVAQAQAQSSTLAAGSVGGVQVYGIEHQNLPPRMVYEPNHPHADAKGFVAYPNIDHAGEMTQMVKTMRVYEANVVMLNAARTMYMKAMELGSR